MYHIFFIISEQPNLSENLRFHKREKRNEFLDRGAKMAKNRNKKKNNKEVGDRGCLF
jgi:hypothetical protein